MLKLTPEEFNILMHRVRQGDADAAHELVRIYEPEIRREVRLRLTDFRLRRTMDSMDICQSVLGNFFVKMSLGHFELDRPQQLLRLLITMTRHKVIDKNRRRQARAPVVSPDDLGNVPWEPVNGDETPSEVVATQEIFSEVKARLTEKEHKIAECRRVGMTWNEVGKQLGESSEAVRKTLERAMSRILGELGMSD